MTQPKVTVLMSVLNGEDYLREAIDSILAQTFTDFEFLIIDNASTDGTAAIIASYGDARIRCIRNDSVLTLTQSLNKGLKAARGEYIARLDADDIAMTDRLQAQVSYLDTRPEVALVASAWTDFFGKDISQQIPGPIPPSDHQELLAALAEDNVLAHSSLMFRRDAVCTVGGYPEEFAYAMEYALYFKLAAYHRLGSLPKALVAMRNHEGQVTNRAALRAEHLLEEYRIAAKATRSPALDAIGQRRALRKQVKMMVQLSVTHFHNRRIAAAACWLSRGFITSPGIFLCLISRFIPKAVDRGA
tara:strand:- start:2570 stop:3475 length:906 start_codon:yes stop_codon:yes gene_type:complete